MGFLSNILGEIVDSALIGIAVVSADIEFALSSLGISVNRSTSSTSAPHPDPVFFAQADLDHLKSCILPHADLIEAQLIENRIAYYTAPFELWIPEHDLNSIKEIFADAINNAHNGAFTDIINSLLSPNNEACNKVFSISSDVERQSAISTYREIIEKRSCEQFVMLCDDVITQLLPKLLAVAEQVLSGKSAEQEQRDLDREQLLITRAKLTMIDDYLNSNA